MFVCIYCGKHGKRSKEHVVADWINDLLPGSEEFHFNIGRQRYLQEDGGIDFIQTADRRNGSVGSVGIATVCEVCNNGWMSVVVNNAVPSVRGLVSGNVESFDPDNLVKWIVLTTMNVMELFGESAISDLERRVFCEKGGVPESWGIFVSLTTGVVSRAQTLRVGAMHIEQRHDRNCFVYTLCVGNALFHIVKLPDHGALRIDFSRYANELGISCIGPHMYRHPLLVRAGPALPILSVDEVRRVGTHLMDDLILRFRGDAPGMFDDWVRGRSEDVWWEISRIGRARLRPEQ